MLKCIIIDDERSSINVIERYVEKIPSLQLVGTAMDSICGLELIKNTNCQVVFLDIEMDGISGIELANTLKNVQIIFCTGYPEFAVKSYDIGAVDYLLKPIPFNRFIKAVRKLVDIGLPNTRQDQTEGNYFVVKMKHKGTLKKIDADDLEYAEAGVDYTTLHLRGGQMIMVYSSLEKVERRLSSTQFCRIHRHYIVAIKAIEIIEGGIVILKSSGLKLTIEESYRKAFMNKIRDRLLLP